MPKNKNKRASKSRKNTRVAVKGKGKSNSEYGFSASESQGQNSTNQYGFSPQRRLSKKGAKRQPTVYNNFPSEYEGFPSEYEGFPSEYEGFPSNTSSSKSSKTKSKKTKSSSEEYGWNSNVSMFNTPEGHSVQGKTKKRTRCPNGYRKTPKTGNCEEKPKNQNTKVSVKQKSPAVNNKPLPKVKLPRVGGLVFLPASLSKHTPNKTGVSGSESLLDHWDKYSTTGVSKIMKKRQKTVDGEYVTDKLGLYIYNSGQFIIKDPEQVRPLTQKENKRLFKPSKASRLAQTNLDSFESEMLRKA
jgi:hypothetical protein